MLSIELEPCDAYVDTASPPAGDGILSFFGLAGSWVGTGSISCSAAFAFKISSQFLMAEYTSVNEDVLDAVAEITNMIIGNVKTLLEEDLGPTGLSIPTVIFGRNFASRTVINPKSGSSNSADRAKSLKCLGISTASQFTIRVITDFAATACGLKIYPVLSGSNCRI